MKKQKVQLGVLMLVIIAAVCVLLLLKHNNEQDAKKEEAENAGTVLDEIDSTSVVSFSYYVNGQEISFEKTDEEWNCVQDMTKKIDKEKINALLEQVSQITADEVLTEVDNLEEYGLLEPKNTVRIVCENKEICYEIGNYNEVVGGYYVKKKGEDAVYLVSGSIATAFTQEADAFLVEADETVSENTTDISISGNTTENVTEE